MDRNACCKTVIAAERNKTEFIQSQDQKRELPDFSIVPVVRHVEMLQTSYQFPGRAVLFVSPPKDIPIFTSSLLI